MTPLRRPSWEQSFRQRLRFERAAFSAYPDLCRSNTGRRRYARVVYRVVVPVPHYEARRVELHFRRTTSLPILTSVYADGPTESPHRYSPNRKDPLRRPPLCIWYPHDPPELRWVPRDGLLALVEMTRIHLFKEAYYRETGEWLGEEVSHDSTARGKAC